jgi:hypothetical protein
MCNALGVDIEERPSHLIANGLVDEVVDPLLALDELLEVPVVEFHHDVEFPPVGDGLLVDVDGLDDEVASQLPADDFLSALVLIAEEYFFERIMFTRSFNSDPINRGELATLQFLEELHLAHLTLLQEVVDLLLVEFV